MTSTQRIQALCSRLPDLVEALPLPEVFAEILVSCRSGSGYRTTEAGSIAFALLQTGGEGRESWSTQQVSNAITVLLEAKLLRCATESWRDYCWAEAEVGGLDR